MQQHDLSKDTDIQFNPIALTDYGCFKKIFDNVEQPISHYSFSVMFAYGDLLKLRWLRAYDHICIFMFCENLMHLFIPPMAEEASSLENFKKALIYSLQIINHFNSNTGLEYAGRINAVSAVMREKIQACQIQNLKFIPFPSGNDYVYDMSKIISLAGPDLASKRQEKNKFLRTYPKHATEPMREEYMPACLDLLKKWNNQARTFNKLADAEYQQEEADACHRIITNWQSLGMKGMVLFVEKQLIGFTFGTPLTSTQVLILIEKTDPDFKNAPAFIFSEFCKQFWSTFDECNCDDDGNNPKLQFTKMHYRPKYFLNKFSVIQTA